MYVRKNVMDVWMNVCMFMSDGAR